MSDNDAEAIWKLILEKYDSSWDKIEEEIPDEIDIQMLDAIDKDPECHVFTK